MRCMTNSSQTEWHECATCITLGCLPGFNRWLRIGLCVSVVLRNPHDMKVLFTAACFTKLVPDML